MSKGNLSTRHTTVNTSVPSMAQLGTPAYGKEALSQVVVGSEAGFDSRKHPLTSSSRSLPVAILEGVSLEIYAVHIKPRNGNGNAYILHCA